MSGSNVSAGPPDSAARLVLLRGLPFQATRADLAGFFAGFELQDLGMGTDSAGRPTGEASALLSSPEAAARAVRELDGKYLGPRYLQLRLASAVVQPDPPDSRADLSLGATLLERQWVRLVDSGPAEELTVMSWNVLACGLGDDQFGDRPQAVRWSHRAPLLLQEIQRAEPGIVCLCEENYHERFWVPEMRRLGFEGFVRAEKPCSPCRNFFPAGTEDVNDGCAVFYDTGRFSQEKDISGRLGSGSKVVAGVVLREHRSGRLLCVAVCHLTMGGHRGQHRAQEMGILLERLAREVDSDVPIVLCGDWNEPPGAVCAMVEKECGLVSAYKDTVPQYTAQDFTATWCSGVEREVIPGIPKGAYMDYIDFIYYSADQLKVSEVWEPPEFQSTLPDGIPGMRYPSDHVAIACKFMWN